MKRILITASLLALGVAHLCAQAKPSNNGENNGGEKKDDQLASVVTPLSRFEGTAKLTAKGAAPATLHVSKKNWGIHGRQKIERFPEAGFLIVHLHSGLVTTIIAGKEEKRKVGDYWTVPAGSQMSVHVTSESASLETFSIK
jgi:hypothetical protein